MMFFGTSGVLSHRLMHGPMANRFELESNAQSTRMRRDVSSRVGPMRALDGMGCAIHACVRARIRRRGW